MSAGANQGFVRAWVEACILPGTTVTSGTNRRRRGRQPKLRFTGFGHVDEKRKAAKKIQNSPFIFLVKRQTTIVWMAKQNPIFSSRSRIHGYPTTDRSNTTTRKKCPPSAAYVVPFRVILLSLFASFDVGRVRPRGSRMYGCNHNQCLLYVRNQPPQTKRKQQQK